MIDWAIFSDCLVPLIEFFGAERVPVLFRHEPPCFDHCVGDCTGDFATSEPWLNKVTPKYVLSFQEEEGLGDLHRTKENGAVRTGLSTELLPEAPK